MKVIRWLGAYGRGSSLRAALHWEFTQQERKELAAEPLLNKFDQESQIDCKVGLLVKRSAIKKIYRGDVFSKVDSSNGCLKKTRHHLESTYHGEAFVAPCYVAIVVKGWLEISESTRRLLVSQAREHSLKILDYNDNYREVDLRHYQS